MKNPKAQLFQTVAAVYGVAAGLSALSLLFTYGIFFTLIGTLAASIPVVLLLVFAEVLELLDTINCKLTVLVPNTPIDGGPTHWEQAAVNLTEQLPSNPSTPDQPAPSATATEPEKPLEESNL